jgi:hypothetical protein
MAYLGQGAEGNFTTTNAKDTFSGNGSTTTFTLSQRGTENNVDVFVNNVRQEPGVAYNIEGNGTSLVFTAAPSSGTNNIYVVNRGPAELSASHPASQNLEAADGTFTGDLLVGKTSSDFTTVGAELLANGKGRFTQSAGTPMNINRTTDDGTLVAFYQDGESVGWIGVEANDNFFLATASTPNTGISFKTDFIVPIGTNGLQRDNAIDLGSSAARFNDLYLGGGVYVGGTGSANHLDDYEEGTFVPTVTTTSGSVTMSANDDAAYTKIGRQVTVQGRLDVSSVSSPTGNLTIGNLPFAIANLAALSNRSVQYGFITIGSSGTGNPVVCEFVENTSEAILRTEAWTGAASILTTNSRIQFSWTYFTT